MSLNLEFYHWHFDERQQNQKWAWTGIIGNISAGKKTENGVCALNKCVFLEMNAMRTSTLCELIEATDLLLHIFQMSAVPIVKNAKSTRGQEARKSF